MAAPLLVVRHGVAVDRKDWPHDDDERPLTPEGQQQADVLSAWLARQPTVGHRLLSSPTRRCLATLEPYAARTAQPIEACDGLCPNREVEAAELARRLLATGGGVLCTHGEVMPGLLGAVATRLDGPAPADSEKGSVWVLHRLAGAGAEVAQLGVEGRYLGPDRLTREAGA